MHYIFLQLLEQVITESFIIDLSQDSMTNHQSFNFLDSATGVESFMVIFNKLIFLFILLLLHSLVVLDVDVDGVGSIVVDIDIDVNILTLVSSPQVSQRHIHYLFAVGQIMGGIYFALVEYLLKLVGCK